MLLYDLAFGVFDHGPEGTERELYVEFTGFDDVLIFSAVEFCQWWSPGSTHQRAVALYRLRLSTFDGKNAKPKSVRAHGRELYFHIATSDLKILLRGGIGVLPKKASGANGASAFQNVAAVVTVGHGFSILKKTKDMELVSRKRGTETIHTNMATASACRVYSCRKAEDAWMNSIQRAPMTGPWPELGTIQRQECGMALDISTESSTGYRGSRSP